MHWRNNMGKDNQNKDDGQELFNIEWSTNMENMKRSLPMIMEYQGCAAKLLFNYYVELKTSGFTPAQALQIVCEHGCLPKVNIKPKKEID